MGENPDGDLEMSVQILRGVVKMDAFFNLSFNRINEQIGE